MFIYGVNYNLIMTFWMILDGMFVGLTLRLLLCQWELRVHCCGSQGNLVE